MTPEQVAAVTPPLLFLAAVGAVFLLVGWLGPKLLAAQEERKGYPAPPAGLSDLPEVPSGPGPGSGSRLIDADLMAVAREVDGLEYQP